MHKARAFFYVCGGLFLLALSYHLGARNAGAQSGNAIVGFASSTCPGGLYAVTSTGDVYFRPQSNLCGNPVFGAAAAPIGNFFDGAPTPTHQETWGALKSRYRGERGATQTTPQGR